MTFWQWYVLLDVIASLGVVVWFWRDPDTVIDGLERIRGWLLPPGAAHLCPYRGDPDRGVYRHIEFCD